MKITPKGQVTIPEDIRERLGLLPHTEPGWCGARLDLPARCPPVPGGLSGRKGLRDVPPLGRRTTISLAGFLYRSARCHRWDDPPHPWRFALPHLPFPRL